MKKEPRAYYNDNNKFCAAWLRNLIDGGKLPRGDVDDRSIGEIKASELRGYSQCHFFAGIGGWPLALALAGFSSQYVWSASCPCQPWSQARIHHQQTKRERDARDLWPIFYELARQLKPNAIVGEQVVGKNALPWISRMRNDLHKIDYQIIQQKREAKDYGSPQNRARLYFLANLDGTRRPRLVAGKDTRSERFWRWGHEKDLFAISRAPFERGDRWPQPLLRSGDARLPGRVDIVRAFGNAIDPFVAAEFIRDAVNQKSQGFGG